MRITRSNLFNRNTKSPFDESQMGFFCVKDVAYTSLLSKNLSSIMKSTFQRPCERLKA